MKEEGDISTKQEQMSVKKKKTRKQGRDKTEINE